jgi:hypothetical protein
MNMRIIRISYNDASHINRTAYNDDAEPKDNTPKPIKNHDLENDPKSNLAPKPERNMEPHDLDDEMGHVSIPEIKDYIKNFITGYRRNEIVNHFNECPRCEDNYLTIKLQLADI